jgi:hypothetical protein
LAAVAAPKPQMRRGRRWLVPASRVDIESDME